MPVILCMSTKGLRRMLLAMSLVLLPPLAGAQAASEAAVKAGFVYNFIKFTQWAATRESHSLRLCAGSVRPLEGQLERLQGRTVGSRTIEVRTGVSPADWRQCDALFIGPDDDARQVPLNLRNLGAAVLTMGDMPGFVEAGGMIGLRVEDNRVRFDVNLSSAQRAGLALNSQMLQLAGKVLQ